MKSFKEFITEGDNDDKQRHYPISRADKEYRDSLNRDEIFDDHITRRNIHDSGEYMKGLEAGKKAFVKYGPLLRDKYGYKGPIIHWRKGK